MHVFGHGATTPISGAMRVFFFFTYRDLFVFFLFHRIHMQSRHLGRFFVTGFNLHFCIGSLGVLVFSLWIWIPSRQNRSAAGNCIVGLFPSPRRGPESGGVLLLWIVRGGGAAAVDILGKRGGCTYDGSQKKLFRTHVMRERFTFLFLSTGDLFFMRLLAAIVMYHIWRQARASTAQPRDGGKH
jgi:hypothetical protein